MKIVNNEKSKVIIKNTGIIQIIAIALFLLVNISSKVSDVIFYNVLFKLTVLILSIALIIIGIGLFRLREWARKALIVELYLWLVLSFCVAIVPLAMVIMNPRYPKTIFMLTIIAILGSFLFHKNIIYFKNENVRGCFNR